MKRWLAAALVAMLSAALVISAPPAIATTPEEAPRGTSTDGVAPVIVLLDVSDSMNEGDGAGTVKLRGAKAAVRDIVGQLESSTVFGLWVFPASSCDGGAYVTEPAALNADRSKVLGSIDAMSADGDTPTGVALRALADDLTTRGYTGATIVLVSDGESTCGPPPCDVAKEIVDEGFNVTIPTVAFRTSTAGAAEMSCIAEATGAKTFTAGDSAELAAQLNQLVNAQLELTVKYDTAPMAGGSTKITATVKHLGGQDANDVRLALTFAAPSDPAMRRAAVPPVIRVGNIPRGGEPIERTWTVGTGSRGSTATTTFTLSAWGTNVLRVVSEGTYTTTTPKYVKSELGELFSQVTNKTPVIIFGDSYSSGEGVGNQDYYSTPPGVDRACHRSQKTYLGTVFPAEQMTILACSGAITSDLILSSARAEMPQLQELERGGKVPGAGVLTFGGNDIKFPEIVTDCITPWKSCGGEDYRAGKVDAAEGTGTQLETTYKRAWSAMNTPALRNKRNGTYVPLLVLAYPAVTHEAYRGSCHDFDANEVITADELTKALNDTVKKSVNAVRAAGYEVYYVSDTKEAVRPDHTVCETTGDAYINGYIPAPNGSFAAQESIHPKVSGYLAETDAIIRWSRTATRITPKVSDATISNDLRDVPPPSEVNWPTPYDPQKDVEQLTLVRGGAVAPRSTGNAPGSPVTVVIHSDPVFIGALVADENGDISGTLRIPDNVAVGQHELITSGLDAEGQYWETIIPVTVIEPTPFWVWAALAAAVLGLVSGAALILIGVGRRRTVGSP